MELWQPGTRLDSWMYRIAQNIWLDRVRANKVRGEAVDIETMAGLTGTDGRVVAESELTLQAVAAALSRLPAEQRATVALVCIEGASYKEAAEISGVPVGTVMSRLARARRTLNAALNPPERADMAPLPAKTGS
jgi:RNA polymerase sigma-70 factor (ECF subfamily)